MKTVLQFLLAAAIILLGLYVMNAYYTWPCEELRQNPLTQNGYAPARCIK